MSGRFYRTAVRVRPWRRNDAALGDGIVFGRRSIRAANSNDVVSPRRRCCHSWQHHVCSMSEYVFPTLCRLGEFRGIAVAYSARDAGSFSACGC